MAMEQFGLPDIPNRRSSQDSIPPVHTPVTVSEAGSFPRTKRTWQKHIVDEICRVGKDIVLKQWRWNSLVRAGQGNIFSDPADLVNDVFLPGSAYEALHTTLRNRQLWTQWRWNSLVRAGQG
jgi:hypothetical protein